MSASIAYYSFLCLIPLCIIIIFITNNLLSQFIDPSVVVAKSTLLSREISPQFAAFLGETLQRIKKYGIKFSIFGILVLIWAARNIFLSLEYSLNKAWEIEETRSVIKRNLIALGFIPIVGIVFGSSIIFSIFTEIISRYKFTRFLHLETAFQLIEWLIIPVLLTFVFCLLYKFLPNMHVPFFWTIPGALIATLSWKLAEKVYIWFLSHMAKLSIIYGSLSSVIALLLWLLLCSNIFLIGAEFTSVYVHYKKTGSLRTY